MKVIENKKSTRRVALSLVVFLFLVTAACMFYLFWLLYLLPAQEQTKSYIADIYQDGKLIQSIPLEQVKETYSFDITGENGCINHIEVRPGSIGVLWADCPDKLCVNQGFIQSPAIPITCLPNRLVIILRATDDSDPDNMDTVTY